MKKSTVAILVIVLLVIFGAIFYLYHVKMSKRLLDQSLEIGEIVHELNSKINELENELDKLNQEPNDNSNSDSDNNTNSVLDTSSESVSTETFYATIKKITETNGKTVLLVDGLDVNDINGRGEFDFSIKETTKLVWRGTELEVSDLKVGQNVAITYDGIVLERYPAGIQNVLRVKVLDDKI